MKLRYIHLLVVAFFLCTSCGIVGKKKIDNSASGRTKKVLKEAHAYLGTPYKYGGTNKRGMDCSGLVWTSFKEVNIDLPRVSREQAKHGNKVKLSRVQPGDLLFFKTSGSRISHVGIVDEIKKGEIFFIHASSSKGVTISSLKNSYWNKRFVKAVRYIN